MHVIAGIAFYATVIFLWLRVTLTWYFSIYILYSLGWFCMILMLLSYHCTLIKQGLTTNEHIKSHFYDYLKDKNGVFHNPFNKGSFLSNFIDAIFPDQKVYFKRDEYLYDQLPLAHRRMNRNDNDNSNKSNTNDESKELLLDSKV